MKNGPGPKAPYIGTVIGNGSKASRMGSNVSGILVTVEGEKIGAEMSCHYDADVGKDVIEIKLNGGRTGANIRSLVFFIQKDI